MARTVLRPDLDAVVAQRFGRPAVARAVALLRDEAQRRAPVTRVWVTAKDERVRATHIETDTQVVPDNLRFKVPSVDGVGHDLARHPRDPDLPLANSANCRCNDPVVPHLLRESIHATDVTVVGNLAHASVETRFPRAAESEVGNPGADAPAHFMLGALIEVAARLRGTATT